MRAPKRKRPILRQITTQLGLDLEELARCVSYVGSPEHKDTPSFAGQPKPRADASICDRRLAWEQEKVTEWLKTAIRRGAISSFLEGGFPRYAWYRENETVYEARLVNQDLGEYKGYPLNDTERVEGLDLIYE